MSGLSRAERLLRLASEQSSEKRRELLREITEIFLVDPESYSDSERSHFGEIISTVARSSGFEARVELAGRFADIEAAPRQVVRQLITDEIEVAGPLLECNPSLADEDLISVVRSQGAAHQSSVARRRGLSATVSDVLVEDGHSEAVVTLLKNDSASIAQTTMERAAMRSMSDVALQEALVDRRDSGPELLQDVFWAASPALRRKIVSVTAEAEPHALANAKVRPAGSSDASGETAPPHAQAVAYIDKMQKEGWFGRPLIIDLLRRKAMPELIVGFARLVNVPEVTAERILLDRTGEGLAIACRASAFDHSTFATFVRFDVPGCPRTDVEREEMIEMFESLTVEIAQRIMRFWRVRQASLVVVKK